MAAKGVEERFSYIFSVISATIIAETDAVALWLCCATDSSGDSVALFKRTSRQPSVSRLAFELHFQPKKWKMLRLAQIAES